MTDAANPEPPPAILAPALRHGPRGLLRMRAPLV